MKSLIRLLLLLLLCNLNIAQASTHEVDKSFKCYISADTATPAYIQTMDRLDTAQTLPNPTSVSALIMIALNAKYAVHYSIPQIEAILAQNKDHPHQVSLLSIKRVVEKLGYSTTGYLIDSPLDLYTNKQMVAIALDKNNIYHLILAHDHSIYQSYGVGYACPISMNYMMTYYQGLKILVF